MKVILRIITILLVASVVAGAFSLAMNNTSLASDGPDESGQIFQPRERPAGGDHEGGLPAQGVSEILFTLLKLTGITVLILLLQKAFDGLGSWKWKLAQR